MFRRFFEFIIMQSLQGNIYVWLFLALTAFYGYHIASELLGAFFG